MTYAQKIAQLRVQVGDVEKWVHVDWTGDGNTLLFLMPLLTYPVLEGSYTVKVGGVTKTESTDYTLNKENGALTFVSAPGNGVAVSIDNKTVALTDSVWLDILNNSILSLGDDFWKEFTDDTSFTSVANMTSLDLTALQPKCIAVIDFARRKNGSAMDWCQVEDSANWRYSRDENKIYLGTREAFTTAGEPLKIKGLKSYVLGTATSDDIDVQERFMTILEYAAVSRYWRYKIRELVESLSEVTQETTRTKLQEIIMIIDRYDRWYELEKAKLKPTRPARILPAFNNRGGRP